MLVIFVKFVADWYLLIGQFMLLTWRFSQKLANKLKIWMGVFINFQLSVFTYDRRMAIRIGRGIFIVLWIQR
jgi:serine acetyltransferase